MEPSEEIFLKLGRAYEQTGEPTLMLSALTRLESLNPEAGVTAEVQGVLGIRNRYDEDGGNSIYVVMLLNALSGEPVQAQTNLAKVVDQVLAKITNRALFVIISDLFDDVESIRQGLARLRHRRHDVILLQTLDREELRFGFAQPAPFEGLEDEGRLRIDPRALRQAYLEALSHHLEVVSKTALGFGFGYHRLDTHESIGPALAVLFARRNAQIKRSKVG